MMSFFTVISALIFYLLPVLTGRALWVIFERGKKVSFPIISYFIYGSLFIYGIALLEKYVVLPIFPSLTFVPMWMNSLYGILGVSFLVNIISLFKFREFEIRKHIFPFLFSLLLTAGAYMLWMLYTPFQLNWDIYEHQILANLIQRGNFSFVTSQMSDAFTFNGYSSFFHLLVASVQLLVPQGMLAFWNHLTFIHLFLTILASYYLAKTITGDGKIANVSAVLGAFVFESNVAYTSLFVIPQNVTALTFTFLTIQLITELKNNRLPAKTVWFLSCIFLFLNHYIVGMVGVVILGAVYMYFYHYHKVGERIKKLPVLELGLLFLILLALVSSFVPLGFINKGEATFYAFDILDKFRFMQNAYGYSLLLFLPIGILTAIRQKNIENNISLVIFFFLFGIVMTQFPYVLKIYVLTRFFIHVFMAIGIWRILNLIQSKVLQKGALFSFFLMMLSILITNFAYFKSILSYQSMFTQISKSEIDAADFLKQNYSGKNILLVSEPATQNILEALSGVNSAGGAYASSYVRNQLGAISQAATTAEVKTRLFRIIDTVEPKDSERLFIVGGRYMNWQKAKKEEKEVFSFNIWAPVNSAFSDYKYIDYLEASGNFTKVYQNDGVTIFEVRRVD